MKKINYQIYSLGCKVNQYDGAVLARLLEEQGFTKGTKPKLVIINTCSVTQRAITKDRQLINELRRKFPQAKFLIMGCWPQTDKEVTAQFLDKNFIFWGVGKLKKLSQKIQTIFKNELTLVSTKLASAKLAPTKLISPQLEAAKQKKQKNQLMISGFLAPTDRSRYFLKVADGCNQFCAYCLIPFARGPLQSRPLAEIVKEAEEAIRAGYREIVLSGIHLGRYGQDLNSSKNNLVVLLKEILKLPNLGRLRLSSIEINEVDAKLIKLIVQNPKICRHLHISLQSGSDKILKLMKRPYNTQYFSNRVQKIRQFLPEIAISTDIIVGFPGEEENDFKATYDFAKKINFSKIHVFSFSAHKITAAYKLPNPVSAQEIKRRSQVLRKLSAQLESDYQKRILNLYRHKPLELIKEQSRKSGKIRAKTEYGFDLQLSPQTVKKHRFI